MAVLLQLLLCVQEPGSVMDGAYGPLELPSQSPLQSFRSGFRPRTAPTIPPGGFQFTGTADWANVWAKNDGDYLIDFEFLRTSVSITWAPEERLAVGISVAHQERFGGSMDRFIQNAHRILGVSQGGRDEVPRNGNVIRVVDESEDPPAVTESTSTGSYSTPLVLSADLIAMREPVVVSCWLSVGTDLDPPSESRGGAPVDAAAGLSVAARWGDVVFYAGVGLAWFGEEEVVGLELRSTQVQGQAAVEWKVARRCSLLLQYLVTEGQAEDFDPFSRPSHEVTLGIKVEPVAGTVLEFGVLENIILSDNSPDFGLHAGMTFRW